MRLFAPLYERALAWSAAPRAPLFLGILSFFEAFIFPIPPEVMIAPMTLARPKRGFHFAAISLFSSMFGCMVGYAIGHYAIDWAQPWLERLGYWPAFLKVQEQLASNGFWWLLIGGFTPIPFKILTIAAGAVGVPLPQFLAGAFIGRGKRVFLVAGAIMLGGERAERAIHRYIEWIGWGVVILIVAALVALRLWH